MMGKETPVKQRFQTEDAFEFTDARSKKSAVMTFAETAMMITTSVLVIGLFSMPVAFHFTVSVTDFVCNACLCNDAVLYWSAINILLQV